MTQLGSPADRAAAARAHLEVGEVGLLRGTTTLARAVGRGSHLRG